jgi:hypothetical protein
MSMSRTSFGDTAARSRIGVACLSGIVLVLAVLARLAWLDNLPGVNGDEAWYGLWIERALRDHLWGGATPSGLFPNPFFLVPLGFVQAAANPAPWVLRAPAVLAGLGFIIVGYACLRSLFGRSAAVVFALLAATAPTAIAYSRFGWDASETPLAAMIFLWCCLSGQRLCSTVSLLVAFVVHPTNIFLAPIFVAFVCEDLKPWAAKLAGDAVARHMLGIMMAGGMLAAVAVRILLGSVAHTDHAGVRDLADAHYWLRIAGLFSDLFSGITVYRYIVGPPGGVVLHRVIASLALVGCLALLLVGPRSARDPRATTLLAGLSVSAFAFAVIVGPSGLSPGWERYAQFVIAPVLLLASIALGRAFDERSVGGVLCAAILGCLALASFWANYFEPLRLTGGWRHQTFRTAAIEPKVQTAHWISARAVRCSPIVVRADSWWLAKPLQYFLFYRSDISVRQLVEGTLPGTGSCDDLIVTFADSLPDKDASRVATRVKTVLDASGRDLIQIYSVEPKNERFDAAPSPAR